MKVAAVGALERIVTLQQAIKTAKPTFQRIDDILASLTGLNSLTRKGQGDA